MGRMSMKTATETRTTGGMAVPALSTSVTHCPGLRPHHRQLARPLGPAVSLENCRIYARRLKEYAEKAVRQE